jgi:hypothetical protein
MKRSIFIFSILIFLSFSLNTISVMAEPKTLNEGLYKLRDSGLSAGITYKVRNTSLSGKSIIIIIDPNQSLQEFIKLDPSSIDYLIKPLEYGSTIIIVGSGNIVFS